MIDLLVELLFGTVVFYVLAASVACAVLVVPAVAMKGAASGVRERLDRRSARRLHWSKPADEVARALIAEQAIVFSIGYRQRTRRHRLEFMLVPLSQLPALESESSEPDRWQIFCPALSSACIACLPWNGVDLVKRLNVAEADRAPGAEALDTVMSQMTAQLWGRG